MKGWDPWRHTVASEVGLHFSRLETQLTSAAACSVVCTEILGLHLLLPFKSMTSFAVAQPSRYQGVNTRRVDIRSH
uniref:Uncharacterized protein n=1 Tax=Physcomitrium patens TaxID=3218 RepID=A0A2K1J490_PHYPA|nr:hypothetical protein PHYPA_022198 [Physcomitrium patens]